MTCRSLRNWRTVHCCSLLTLVAGDLFWQRFAPAWWTPLVDPDMWQLLDNNRQQDLLAWATDNPDWELRFQESCCSYLVKRNERP
jgi:hypothetical protein